MISKSQIKLISSLKLKKERFETGLFTVEGEKPVQELLQTGWPVELLVVKNSWYEKHSAPWISQATVNVALVSDTDMERMTQLASHAPVLAVARMQSLPWTWQKGGKGYVLVLDRIADPGNLGTMIRIADWFGFAGVLCSSDTVDYYNSKTIQASMGSVFRVPMLYADLQEWVAREAKERIYAAVLNGNPLHQQTFGDGGLLLVGSEAHGLSPALVELAGQRITIPSFGEAESLNAAVATGIIASWMRLR